MSTLDLDAAAEMCKCSSEQMRRLLAVGEAPGTKIGRRWIVSAELLQKWIDARCHRDRTDDIRLVRAIEIGRQYKNQALTFYETNENVLKLTLARTNVAQGIVSRRSVHARHLA